MAPINWHGMFVPDLNPLETMLRAAVVYLAFIVALRVTGRRQLTRLSMFDATVLLLITITLRRTVTSNDDSVTTGFIALATMFAIDRGLDAIAYRSDRWRGLLEGRAAVLVRDGKPDLRALRHHRIGDGEMREILRENGGLTLTDIDTMWIERTGRISVKKREQRPPQTPH